MINRSSKFADFVRIDEKKFQAYLSGTLQVPDVIEWLLEQTGPADVLLSSFSISDESLRRIYLLRRKGLIRELSLILDFKATQKTLKLWPFIAKTVDRCFLTDNHSKVILLLNEAYKVAVVTSQNLTRGNRNEAGVITLDREIFDCLASRLENIMSNQSVPFHDVYNARIKEN